MYSYGSYESQRITKHSYHYYGSPKIEPGELEIGHHVNSYGRVAYVPRMSGVSGAYSYFIPGTVTWHGHKYRALYTDGGVMTHKHIRHEFKVPRSYHY